MKDLFGFDDGYENDSEEPAKWSEIAGDTWVPTNRPRCKNGCEGENWRFYMKRGNLIRFDCADCNGRAGFLPRSFLVDSEGA